MSDILGRLLTAEDGTPIAGMTVTASSASRAARGETLILGTDVSNRDGRFRISIPRGAEPGEQPGGGHADAFHAIVISVLAPTVAGKEAKKIHATDTLKVHVDADLNLDLRFNAETLLGADIEPPNVFSEKRSAIDNDKASLRLGDSVNDNVTALLRERVDEKREARKRFREGPLQAFLESISSAPKFLSDKSRLVPEGESIEKRNGQSIAGTLQTRFQGNGDQTNALKTSFYLTGERAAKLAEATSGQQSITLKELKRILLQDSLDESQPSTATKPPLLNEMFRERTRCEDVAEQLLGLSAESEGIGPPQPGQNTTAISEDLKLDQLLRNQAAPEEPLSVNVTSNRPDQADIQESVSSFSLRPGPADVPAFHDFSRLQFAFDSLWREIFDDDIKRAYTLAYEGVTSYGGDPGNAEHNGKAPLRALSDELDLVADASRTPNPLVVSYMQRGDGPSNPIGGFPGDIGIDWDWEDPWEDQFPDWFDSDWQIPPVGGGVPPGGGGGGTRPPPGDDDDGDSRGDAVGVTVTPDDATDNTRVDPGTPKPDDLLSRLRRRMNEPYAFTIYAAGEGERFINFGILNTYRQKWTPVTYQVGDLVKTMTLAPGETKSYKTKTVIRKKRAEKEHEKWTQLDTSSTSNTSRAQSEILRKASHDTNFSLETDGSYNFGIAKGDSETKLSTSAKKDSQDTKNDFRESVIKAAQEYKQERSIEITTEETLESQIEESTEITNENDELAVTYLFYELQRRYRINEHLHRVTPVILVAQEVPKPKDITNAWIVEHEWMLRRAILDADYLQPLHYVVKELAGDRLALQELIVSVGRQRRLVDSIETDISEIEERTAVRERELLEAKYRLAQEQEAEDKDGFFADFSQSLGFSEGQSVDAYRTREEAAKMAEQQAKEELERARMKLRAAVSTLERMTHELIIARRDLRNKEVNVARLRVHIRQNILYYMQAIWSYEVPHQRILRLHQQPVPVFKDAGTTVSVSGVPESAKLGILHKKAPEEISGVEVEIKPNIELEGRTVPLIEVADLSSPVGFFGNCIMFPLRESNPVTDFLMAPYVDEGWSVLDPDEPMGMTLEEFADYVCELHKKLTASEFDDIKADLKDRYESLRLGERRQGEEVVVPSGSLYIEPLPSPHAVLEDFKLHHRQLDVKTAQANVRSAEIDNLRKAKRVRADELDDPDIDKKYVVVNDTVKTNVNTDDE